MTCAELLRRRTINNSQRHRVVNQCHRAGYQYRHSSQSRQTRQLRAKIFNHHLFVAKYLIHVDGNSLTRTAENDDRIRLLQGLNATLRGLQQGTGPIEGQCIFLRTPIATGIGLLNVSRRGTSNDFNQMCGDAERQGARAHHDHLCHSGCERQHQFEPRPLVGVTGHFDTSTQGHDFCTNHIQTDATSRQLRYLRRRRQAWCENQIGRFRI